MKTASHHLLVALFAFLVSFTVAHAEQPVQPTSFECPRTLEQLSIQERLDTEDITPQTWQSIALELRREDGSITTANLLRPSWWLDFYDAKEGGTMPLDLPEMGVRGYATVLHIGQTKADSRANRPGTQIVTGKFTHESAEILDIRFGAADAAPLGVTASHPIWSADRKQWIPAGKLLIGENVKTLDGTIAVVSVSKRPQREKVYNLEVHRDHTFYVGYQKVLVHNSCPATPNTNPFKGPVGRDVMVVDAKGNTIPVKSGERLVGSPDGKYTQVLGTDGKPTGFRFDDGHPPSPKHTDPRSLQPHAHVPGVTTSDGKPWLPLNQ